MFAASALSVFGIHRLDNQKAAPTSAKVTMMGTMEGISIPKASIIMNNPRKPIDVNAPFFRYLYCWVLNPVGFLTGF